MFPSASPNQWETGWYINNSPGLASIMLLWVIFYAPQKVLLGIEPHLYLIFYFVDFNTPFRLFSFNSFSQWWLSSHNFMNLVDFKITSKYLFVYLFLNWSTVDLLQDQVQSLGWEDLLEKRMATHPSIPAWRIQWTEEPGGWRSIGSQRVRHHWATNTFTLS